MEITQHEKPSDFWFAVGVVVVGLGILLTLWFLGG
jgi:uncharacterized membrane protein YqiK